MRTWLLKLRLSLALDRQDPPSAAQLRQGMTSPEAAQLAESALDLDARLRRSRTPAPAPAGLHGQIMQSLRQAQPVPLTRPLWPRLALPLSVAGTAVGLALLVALRQSSPPATPSTAQSKTEATPASATLDLDAAFADLAPPPVTSPLSHELENLGTDLKRVGEFLLASVP